MSGAQLRRCDASLALFPIITCSALVLACTASPAVRVEDPFVGNWVTAENASITIRPDTIVQHQPDGESTTLDKTACRGMFSFAHGTKSRQDLTSLVPRQPDLRQKISDILVEQSYPVAELNCDIAPMISSSAPFARELACSSSPRSAERTHAMAATDNDKAEQVEELLGTPGLADALESEQFRRFLDQIPIAIVVSELKLREHIVYANPEFEKLSGQNAIANTN